ncbi:MAG: hypothetical protein KGH75_00040 [Rhodospirillales bacterium]|nr:hypothetical protein [Rhodospirillales bacterium]
MLLDLSSNNHPNGAGIDYAAVKAAGVTGVMVKATDGTTYINPYYGQDTAGFAAVGVPTIGYHFAEFGDAATEARHFVSVAGSKARMLDSETSTDQAWQDAFLAALNLWPGQELDYGSASTLPRGVRALLFPAQYGKAPGFGDCWQFTSTATVDGVSGPVDLSEWTGSAADFDSVFGITPAPSGPPPQWTTKPLSGKFGNLNAPTVAIVHTPSGNGYTEVAADGGTFAYGDAPFLGSLAGAHLNAPIIDAVGTPDGRGLVMVATDGGVFCFGTAQYEGAMGGKPLNAPVVSIALHPNGGGYWLLGADGGIFAFGTAGFHGSPA